MRDYSKYVHEYVGRDGRTRYVVAHRRGDGWYVAPMSDKGYRLTGAVWLAGRRAVDVAGSTTYTYARRCDAVRRARDLYGVDDDYED